MQVTTVGLDLAKNVFHLHGIAVDGSVAFSRSLRRRQMRSFFERLEPCLIGMEACGTSHYWARELTRLGHNVRLIAPIYVKPYVKRGKSDAADAEAICEAVTRPTMRFVEVKSPEQQAILSLHRARDLVVRQRTQMINMLRCLLAESGIIFAQGVGHAVRFARQTTKRQVPEITPLALDTVTDLSEQLLTLHARVLWYGRKLTQASKSEPRIALLQTHPCIGPITASAIVATIGSAGQFRCGRDFSAWLGLTPINRSTGGKERLDQNRFNLNQVERELWSRLICLSKILGPDCFSQIRFCSRTHIEDGRPLYPAPDGHWHDLAYETDQNCSGPI
ncbi:MAG: IS110 family transposase [Pseudomonadota bacterium]